MTTTPEEKPPLRADLTAGLVVFLVALPLCLGIALASGAPLVGGLIAGVVGGLVVGALSPSEVGISGPAAGLAVPLAAAIPQLGSYEAVLAAVVVSGLMQLGFAAARLGPFADFVPTTVIKGMLAAIGIVIVLKQLPHALGRDADFAVDLEYLEPSGKETTLSAIVKAVATASPAAVAISSASIAFMIACDGPLARRLPWAASVPAPLVVVALGVSANELLRVVAPSLALTAADGHLVALPTTLDGLAAKVSTPSLAAFKDPRVYSTGLTIAVVGSLESLLSLEASQKLDPLRRFASPTRELFAQGVGNTVSGLLGGLPVTAGIVRTSANVYAGGQSRRAAILQALFLGVAVLLLPDLLARIPLASLASVLIVVGLKLARAGLFRSMWAEGWASFVPFAVTVAGVVLTNLLTGVLLGLAFGVVFVMRANHHAAMTLVHEGRDHLLRFNKDLTFVNKAELKATLAAVPRGGCLVIDATRSVYLDRDIFDVLDDFAATARSKGIVLESKNLLGKRPQMEP